MSHQGSDGAGGSFPAAPHVVVVGGGITGLAAAWELRRAPEPPRVTVLEGSPAIGGKLALTEVGGVPVDAGAESLLARRPEASDLARAVGLGDDLVVPVTTAARVWSRGGLHPLPAGSVLGVPATLRPALGGRLLTGAEKARLLGDLVLPPTSLGADVAVGRYVAARLGRAVVDRLVEPLLGGVYAGSADTLSLAATMPGLLPHARRHRSLVRAARASRGRAGPAAPGPVFVGLRGGVGRLPGAVAAASGADVRTRTTVRELRRTATGWLLVSGPVPDPVTVAADAVVLAVPARPASRLLAALAPAAAAELGRVEYASVALVTFALPETPLRTGSGLLVPPVEGLRVKAATVSSAKWSWVAPAGRTVLRASLGRHGEEADLQRDDEELAAVAWSDLRRVLPLPARADAARVTRWGGSLPQYAVGHLDVVGRVRTALAGEPTLALAGAAYDGVGVPACIASGRAAARQVLAALAGAPRGTA